MRYQYLTWYFSNNSKTIEITNKKYHILELNKRKILFLHNYLRNDEMSKYK